MTVLHLLHFYRDFPTKVTMNPLNTAIASDIFLAAILSKIKNQTDEHLAIKWQCQ
jgi:hypothetical protein